MQDDGFTESIGLLKAHAVDILGTLEVIIEQAPLFEAKYPPGDVKRTQLIKLITDLANKTSRYGSHADKVMSMIFVGGQDEITSHFHKGEKQHDLPGTDEGRGTPNQGGPSTSLGHSDGGPSEQGNNLQGDLKGEYP